MGYDQPRSLGSNATGGQLAMPIWIEYMQTALKGVPEESAGPIPDGLTSMDGNFYYDEFPKGKAFVNLGTKKGSTTDSGSFISSGGQRFTPIQPRRDPLQQTIESFNPTGGPPIRF